ncbi:hypothetical protein GWK47_008597 [Chionoecetes opilio]|uniref:Glycosyltransferase family 92 protein n=1 Tax=Chionoecetes opilio TaxID=41210 RepID=A0A8J4XZL0_CHIOP|nr:hypothetical protein GWK47_008597 [Chionoecetes opilio]
MPRLVEKGRCQLHESPASHPGDAAMRKYQQLALTIVAVVSLVAFLFYKHEYERLRYTLEYLDTFGEPPAQGEAPHPCGYHVHPVTSSPPADWVQVTSDLEVYSAFLEGEGLVGGQQIRVIGAVRKSTELPADLTCLIWFESNGEVATGSCSVQFASDRVHGHHTQEEDVEVLYLLCSPRNTRLMLTQTPYALQLRVGTEHPSQPLLVHEVEILKTTANKTAVCVVPPEQPVTSLHLVEFIGYHHLIGTERFTLYGPVLTPLVRRLLDRFGDEMGLTHQELLFSTSRGFGLSLPVVRRVVELDCLHRHRDSHENVLVLELDQFVVLGRPSSLQGAIVALEGAGRSRREVAEFHLSSQPVCLDQQHTRRGTLMLAQQVHTAGPTKETGVALLRPHLMAGLASGESSTKSQHVPPGVAVVHHYSTCSPAVAATHLDTHHLPANKQIVTRMQQSLLYRKWTINS